MNLDENSVTCATLDAGLSDHEAVLCPLMMWWSVLQSKKQGRLLTASNFLNLARHFETVNWEKVLTFGDPMSQFHRLLCERVYVAFPVINIKSTNIKSFPFSALLLSLCLPSA